MTAPPQKKRKLNDEDCDYLPSENDEDISEYEPSDDQDDDFTNTNNKNSNGNSDQIEEKDAEMEGNDHDKSDENDNDESDENDNDNDTENNDENKPSLSNEDKKKVRNIFKTIESFTASELKRFLRDLKSLRSIDGESVFEDILMSGKKDEIQKRVKNNIFMIYLGQVIAPSKAKWRWARNKVYKDTIDFDGWKLQIQQFLNVIVSQSSKKSKSKNDSILNGSLMSRLNACDKNQIIAALQLLLNKQENGSELAKEFEELLPKPSLETVFKRHTVLINAISKAQPNSRYGSSRDNYCFKRCRSSVNTAKKAIIQDGKNIMQSKDWDTCLEYLIVESNNINKFPVWDDASNNCAVRDLKKKLKVWYGKVAKGLGKKMNNVQQKRVTQLDLFFNDK